MNRKQRILFSLVITFVFPLFLILGLGISDLTGGNNYLTIIPPLILLAVGVYFLSFKIWDKAEHEAVEDERQIAVRNVNKAQRILLALVITLVPTVNFYLSSGLLKLVADTIPPLDTPWGLMLIMPLTSIVLTVGVYFLSFEIWDKTEQEAGKGEG